MKAILFFIAALTTFHTSMSQDRGCQGSFFTYIISAPDTTIDRSSLIGGFYSTGPFPSYNDTIQIELNDNEPIEVLWSALDRYEHQYSSMVYWYKDNQQIDTNQFEFSFNPDYGDCYNPTTTNTSIKISEAGIYYMYAPGLNSRSSYIHISEKSSPITDSIVNQPITDISLFPNPTQNVINVKHGLIGNGVIEIYNLEGRLIMSTQLDPLKEITRVQLNNFATGTYIIVVQTDAHIVIRKKIVIQ